MVSPAHLYGLEYYKTIAKDDELYEVLLGPVSRRMRNAREAAEVLKFCGKSIRKSPKRLEM